MSYPITTGAPGSTDQPGPEKDRSSPAEIAEANPPSQPAMLSVLLGRDASIQDIDDYEEEIISKVGQIIYSKFHPNSENEEEK